MPEDQGPRLLTPEQTQQIIDRISSLGALGSCPRCGNGNFNIEQSLTLLNLYGPSQGIVIGGPSIPAAILSCSRCGWITLHALGTLGLMHLANQAES